MLENSVSIKYGFICTYVFTQILHFVTQGQFLSRVKLIWFESFPSKPGA